MKIGERFKEDYKYFLSNRILPLIGLPRETIIEDTINYPNFKEYVIFDNKTLILGIFKDSMFKVKSMIDIDEEDLGLIRYAIKEYIKVSRVNYDDSGKNSYGSNEMFHFVTDYSLQKAIANWVSNSDAATSNVELLLNELDNWKLKTYEGKSVTFNFKITNSSKKAILKANEFISEILKEDYSAVLTDPTASLFILNSNCDYIGYKSIFKGKKTSAKYSLENNVPYRFSNIIYNEITGENTFGISLLSNGDIIISKNRNIKFVKRGNKWLNFNGTAFRMALSSNGINYYNQELIDEIFATALDVSFSHCGGIIACIDYDEFQSNQNAYNNKGERPILNDRDNILSGNGLITPKNKLIKSLVSKKSFMEIDRKLRSELSALDGACILTNTGDVVAFGAIIQNESGSTGGGRGAAAKRLSNFGGFAIKISTDGYIELYVKGNKIYTIK